MIEQIYVGFLHNCVAEKAHFDQEAAFVKYEKGIFDVVQAETLKPGVWKRDRRESRKGCLNLRGVDHFAYFNEV